MRVKEIDWSVLDRRTVATAERVRGVLGDQADEHPARQGAGTPARGHTITTSSLHPGGVASNIWRSLPQPVQWFMKLFLDSNEKGAETPLYCATAPELRNVSGRYYDHCREVRPARWRRVKRWLASCGIEPNAC